jgi:hypothetical protein
MNPATAELDRDRIFGTACADVWKGTGSAR